MLAYHCFTPITSNYLFISSFYQWTEEKNQILNEISYSISRVCGCQFSTHKFGQVFAQCQHLDSGSHITLYSWIYGENGDSSYQYREILERISTRSIAFAVNSHEVRIYTLTYTVFVHTIVYVHIYYCDMYKFIIF